MKGKNSRSYLAGKKGKGQGKGGSQKRRREAQQRVTEPLTPKSLRRETQAATNQRFKPLEREIAGDLRASERRVDETGDWWQSYLDTVNQGRSETQAAYDAAGAAGAANVAQISSLDTANTARLQGEDAESAALRGVAPSTAPAQREAAMQGQRNYLDAAQRSTTATLGANQFGYLTDQKRIGVGQSIASRKEEQRRGRSIRSDMRDTRRERGDYAATKRGELRESERDYLINRKAFGLDKRKTRNEETEGAFNRGAKNRELSQRERELNQEGKRIRSGGEKGGMTPTQRREKKEGRKNALATTQAFIAAHGYPKGAAARAELEREVAKESEVSASDARWAVSRVLTRRRNSAGGVAEKVDLNPLD